ncbi:hypothetical protein AVEN_144279-1 [Araneus ventricosus]|uniref:Uncharacterized protein n=1 Tax=Araneus ventricosus TaxID=182803 RepID=A0A4Y2HAK1_ARAVE|nr:hypothetical protein AVEN_144279-1 [Araneus ventricosus]
MIWTAILWFSAVPIMPPEKRITESDLLKYLHPAVHTLLPSGDGVLQNDNCPIQRIRPVEVWFKEHKDEAIQLPGLPQSPDLNIIESLRSLLENVNRHSISFSIVSTETFKISSRGLVIYSFNTLSPIPNQIVLFGGGRIHAISSAGLNFRKIRKFLSLLPIDRTSAVVALPAFL